MAGRVKRKAKQKKMSCSSAVTAITKKRKSRGSSCINPPEGMQLITTFENTRPMRIDILPFLAGKNNINREAGEPTYEATYYVHKGVGTDGRWFVCPKKTVGKPCPICEWVAKQNVRYGQDETVDALRPKERQVFAFVDIKDPDKNIQLLDISHHWFGKVLQNTLESGDPDDGWDSFADVPGGLTLKVCFGEDSYGIKATTINFKKRTNDYSDVLDQVPTLDELLNIVDYDDLNKVFLQGEDEEDEEDEADEEEADEDEEDEADEEEVDEDEEDEADEEEADEDEEDEADEEEADEEEADEDEEDEEDEEEEEEDEEEDEEDEDWDEDDFEDEEAEKKPKKTSKRTAKKKEVKKAAAKKTTKKKVVKKTTKKKTAKRK